MLSISSALLLLSILQPCAALLPAKPLPGPAASRRSLLASTLPVVLLTNAHRAAAIGNTCAREDTKCLEDTRAAANDNIKENAGGFVGVAALLVLRGLGAPNSGMAVAQKKMRAEKLAKSKAKGK